MSEQLVEHKKLLKLASHLLNVSQKLMKNQQINVENLDLVLPMYNLIEYNSNFSEKNRKVMVYSKDETSNFDTDIENIHDFKSFKDKAKLLGNTEADNANGTSKNATIAVPLKYLSSFWRSPEIPLINCRVGLKLR